MPFLPNIKSRLTHRLSLRSSSVDLDRQFWTQQRELREIGINPDGYEFSGPKLHGFLSGVFGWAGMQAMSHQPPVFQCPLVPRYKRTLLHWLSDCISQSYPSDMSGETGHTPGTYSEKVPLSKEQDPVDDPQTPRPPAPGKNNSMARWAFILLMTISLALWSNARGSSGSLSVNQRVDRILTETPLIGRLSSLLSTGLCLNH